jgi:acylphosphatase
MKAVDSAYPNLRRAAWIFALILVLPASIAVGDNDRVQVLRAVAPDVPAATNAVKRVHVFVSGVVQGVGFRDFTTSKATTLKLTGWVKNLKDGRVEIVVEGTSVGIDKLMDAVKKGPSGSRVDKVDRNEESPTGEFRQFKTLR